MAWPVRSAAAQARLPASCRIPACGRRTGAGRCGHLRCAKTARRNAPVRRSPAPLPGTCTRCCLGHPASPTLNGVVHVPAPIVLAHVAKGGADAALRRHRVRPRGEHLGDASRLQPGRAHAERCPQACPTGPNHHHVIGVIDNVVGAIGRLGDRVHGSVRPAKRSGCESHPENGNRGKQP